MTTKEKILKQVFGSLDEVRDIWYVKEAMDKYAHEQVTQERLRIGDVLSKCDTSNTITTLPDTRGHDTRRYYYDSITNEPLSNPGLESQPFYLTLHTGWNEL